MMRTRPLATCLVGLLVFVSACSSGSGKSGGTTTTTSSPSTRPPQFVVRIDLPATVIAGGSRMTGHLVVVNNSGATLRLLSGGKTGCTPQWIVALGNDKIPPDVAFTALCGVKPLVFQPGENRLPFALQASYSHCGRTGVHGPANPACVGSPPMPPPLPADQYRAMFFGDLPGLPKPAAVAVRVTAHS